MSSVPQLTLSTTGITPTQASGQASAAPLSSSSQLPSAVESFDNWIKNFQKYELTLAEMARVSSDAKFKDELTTIEQWFKVLSEPERTASVYTLLQHSSQDQIRFFIAILQQMIRPEEPKAEPVPEEAPAKPKLSKLSTRPPSLDLPNLGSPATPTPLTAKTQDSSIPLPGDGVGQATPKSSVGDWAAMVNTPLLPMFQKPSQDGGDGSKSSAPGLGMLNPYTLNMLANAGLSPEAQMLAVQLVMSGLVQPTGLAASQSQSQPKQKKSTQAHNWRTPTSARYPASALRSSGLRSSGLKSSGLDSASLESPRVEDFNPEMLNDIPAWLRSLRLHKYTSAFDGLSWQEMVVLDDATLEAKGVAALGARRRLLRTFEHVRKQMGMEDSTATPTNADAANKESTPSAEDKGSNPPHSAAPRSKLSINSPIFTPTWEAGSVPHSAAPAVSITPTAS